MYMCIHNNASVLMQSRRIFGNNISCLEKRERERGAGADYISF